MKLYKDRVNRDVLKFSFADRVLEQWNKLPETVVNVSSVITFKNKLDKFIKAIEGNNEFNSIPINSVMVIYQHRHSV